MQVTSSKIKPSLCVGACAWTTIFRVSHLPLGSAKLLPDEAVQTGDGLSASAGCAIVQLGGRAEFWTRVGDDTNACYAIASLVEAGLDCSAVTFVEGARGAFRSVIVEPSGERFVISQTDDALQADISALPLERIARGEFSAVVTELTWPETAAAVLDAARAARIPGILAVDGSEPNALQDVAARASHVLHSQSGLAAHVGAGTASAQLERARRASPNAFVGVTRGAEGFYWQANGETRHAEAVDVAAIDTLAAGDVFRGAFAFALTEGMDIDAGAQFACIAASLKCTVFGGRLGAPDQDTMTRAMSLADELAPA
jgi:sugar/nucleoside kinase (ribokinase family)